MERLAEFSKYPDQIDTTTEIPLATDNVTPVKAESVNRIRDGLIAVESELGINPSGTYSTVRDRLDALEQGGGGGGGSGSVAVAEDGTIIVPQTDTINFTGDVSVTSVIPHRVEVNIGGNTVQKQETLTVSNGQTSFTLSATPIQSNAVEMFVNGLKQQYSGDYTASGTTVTYSGVSLLSTDKVEFWYLVNTGIMGSGGSSVAILPPLKYHEYGVAGVQNTSNTIFTAVGSFEFDPSALYSGSSLIRDFWFEAIILSSTTSVTTSIQVYNLTDGIYIGSTLLTTTSTSSSFSSSPTLIVPTDLPNGSRIYEIHIKRTGGTGTDVAIVKMARLVIRYQSP